MLHAGYVWDVCGAVVPVADRDGVKRLCGAAISAAGAAVRELPTPTGLWLYVRYPFARRWRCLSAQGR